MADLFVSYKSEDRARIKPLVEALQADGLSVWWDADIEGGSGWRQAIQQELEAAKCVLVTWTRGSVGPEGWFVHDEAARAQRRGVYLPVLIDETEPPLVEVEKNHLMRCHIPLDDLRAMQAAGSPIVAAVAAP